VWPELRPFIPTDWMDKPKALVPYDAINEVNKLLASKR
jgi:hypothetical protein